MKVDIIKIGNSKGIRIPKALIDTLGLEEAVEIEIVEGKIVLSPLTKVRENWEEAFRADPPAKDEGLLMGEAPNEFDHSEWQW
ncbi:AbrB/MazE/SpoVT family DNA-binding domain-containing protein [Salaquimonas pukyongi]|uniref:AbrB/MazE/SpoVT family DNA-binding domain-containing protein n=1 Tax=Salaquimonas pukyongi TaxID=2712698 RepID=UPI00096B9312|nr:AbrB/MazE/SpoVT family DNA-binding domain-containing protein [Salaquimonas pukyongi]